MDKKDRTAKISKLIEKYANELDATTKARFEKEIVNLINEDYYETFEQVNQDAFEEEQHIYDDSSIIGEDEILNIEAEILKATDAFEQDILQEVDQFEQENKLTEEELINLVGEN